MPLHITDDATARAARRLAETRNLTLADAVRIACEEALRRDQKAIPLTERLRDIQDRVAVARGDAPAPTKAVFDKGWGGL